MTQRLSSLAVCLTAAVAALSAHALSPGTEVLVPAAGRVNEFVTDLYVANPGDQPIRATVHWLERGQDNSALATSFETMIQPAETAVLNDAIFNDFGLEVGTGAFLVLDGPVD